MGRFKVVALSLVAFATCPCHLPLAVALLGGTSAGAILARNFWVALSALTLLFALTLAALLRVWPGSKGRQG